MKTNPFNDRLRLSFLDLLHEKDPNDFKKLMDRLGLGQKAESQHLNYSAKLVDE